VTGLLALAVTVYICVRRIAVTRWKVIPQQE
jgi:hypothetical protein